MCGRSPEFQFAFRDHVMTNAVCKYQQMHHSTIYYYHFISVQVNSDCRIIRLKRSRVLLSFQTSSLHRPSLKNTNIFNLAQFAVKRDDSKLKQIHCLVVVGLQRPVELPSSVICCLHIQVYRQQITAYYHSLCLISRRSFMLSFSLG